MSLPFPLCSIGAILSLTYFSFACLSEETPSSEVDRRSESHEQDASADDTKVFFIRFDLLVGFQRLHNSEAFEWNCRESHRSFCCSDTGARAVFNFIRFPFIAPECVLPSIFGQNPFSHFIVVLLLSHSLWPFRKLAVVYHNLQCWGVWCCQGRNFKLQCYDKR